MTTNNMSRAKTLCSVVHEITQRAADNGIAMPLPLTMSVTGSNGTARYIRHATKGFYLEQRPKKNATFEHLSSISLLDIGTPSKVSFDNAQRLMVHDIIYALRQKRIFLWLRYEDVNKGEYVYTVLKSNTTQSDYDEMVRMYNAQAASSAQSNPNLTRINKNGLPSRRIGQKYANIPISCDDFGAYPGSYKTTSRPPMPAQRCDPYRKAKAPDGTWWQVECPEGPPRTVCQWKVDRDDPGQQQGAAYKKLEQLDLKRDFVFGAGGGAAGDPAAGGGAAGGGAAGGGGNGGNFNRVVHLGARRQDQDQDWDQDDDMSDTDSSDLMLLRSGRRKPKVNRVPVPGERRPGRNRGREEMEEERFDSILGFPVSDDGDRRREEKMRDERMRRMNRELVSRTRSYDPDILNQPQSTSSTDLIDLRPLVR